MPKRRKCSGTNKQGEPCDASPLRDRDTCIAHSDAQTRASVGFVPEAGKLGGRPRRPREIELIQEVADEFKEQMRQVLIDGLQAERGIVVGNGGTAYVEQMPDHPHRLSTYREIMDRLHGKPRQTTELSGPDGSPVQVASAFDLGKLTVSEKRDLLRLLDKTADV